MKIKKILLLSFSIFVFFVLSTTFGFAQNKSIVETAIEAGSFNTLVKAVQEAGLVDVLSGPGPFTVFAPTDAAFAKIDSTTLTNLVADKPNLTKVLTYHVVSGEYMAADVVSMTSLTSLEGSNLAITVAGSTVQIDGATITTTDIECSNGVIHVIDSVMIPPTVTL